MGNIGYKFLLVVFRACNLAGHIGKGGRQIPHLILAFHRKLVVHVAAGILLCGFGDLAQRNINDFCKKDQDDEGKQEQDDQHDVGNIEQFICLRLNTAHGGVDNHISLDFVVRGNGCKYTEHIFFKGMKKITYCVVGSGSDSGIEIFDHHFIFHIHGGCGRVQNHTAGRINDPDCRIQISIQCV